MTENEETTTEQLDYEIQRLALQPDELLGMLVEVANDGDTPMLGVTLTVGGTLICGTLTGRRAWLAKMLEQYGEPVSFMRAFDARWAEHDAEEPDPEMPKYAGFIHLIGAYALTGAGPAPAGAGMFWRGRLSEIEGWSIGLIETKR